jgi:hypothetical protein
MKAMLTSFSKHTHIYCSYVVSDPTRRGDLSLAFSQPPTTFLLDIPVRQNGNTKIVLKTAGEEMSRPYLRKGKKRKEEKKRNT